MSATEPTQQDIYDAIVIADKAGRPDDVLKLTAYLRQRNAPEAVSPERQAGQELVRGGGPVIPVGAGITTGPSIGALNSAAQGATFGFSDELGGLANVATGGALTGQFDPFSPVQSYTKGRDYLRGVGEQFGKEYPKSALLADVSGGSVYGAPFVAAAKYLGAGKNVGKLGTLAQGAKIGAVAGGVGGAGRAEDFSSIPLEVAKGAAFGAVTSPTLQGLGMGAGGIWNSVAPSLPVIGGAAARAAAQRRVAEAVSRGGMTADEAAAEMARLGPEAGTLDTSAGARGLADTVTNLPGTTRDKVERFLDFRRAGTPERMDVIPKMLNQGNRAQQTIETLTRAQAHAAKPAYAAVENQVVPITPALESLMQRPAFREAFDQAVTNAANRGEQLPLLQDLLKAGPVSGVKVKFWDDVKKGLDDVIGLKKQRLSVTTPSNENQAKSTLQSSLDIKHELVSEIDRLTGGKYKVARDAYAGPAALKNAVEDGQNFWSMSATEIQDALAKMSASEQQAFRIGAGEVLRQKVGSPKGQTELINAWKDRNTREKLQAVYGDMETYGTALSKIYSERQLGKAYAIAGGSPTAQRTAGQEDLASGIAGDVAAGVGGIKTGNPLSVIEAAKKVGSRLATPEPVRNEIGDILLKGGAAGQEQLAQLNAMIKAYNENKYRQAAISGVLTNPFLDPFLRKKY